MPMIPNKTKEVQNNLPAELETKKFNVLVSDKTFSVLFDTLYQDKITSVQRELYSNAIDSHVGADCVDVPISVQLPTVLEPTFRVRDYGTSLTHDEIMGVYSNVFGTTKDGTNEQVGYLGLGSKSPYSYTDSFTVKAYMDGEVRTYLAALDNDRIPTITHTGTKDTDEPRGLEVSFPVRKGDVEEFRTKAAKVCLPLPTKPQFNVGVKVEIPTPVLTLDNGRVKIFESTRGGYSWRLREGASDMPAISIKQGWVVYPVAESEVPSGSWIPRNKSVLIEVPIGTVEVAASRESLSLNDATKKVINKIVEEAGGEVKKWIEKEIASSANYYDACTKYFSKLSGYMTDQNQVLIPQYKGKTLKQMIELDNFPGEGKWRTNRNMKWPVAKADWGKQKPYLNSVSIPNMTFYYKLVDEKVPRMLMRLNDHADDNAILMHDITQADLDKIKKDFALPDSQFKNVTTLPDNPPAKKQPGVSLGTTTKPYKADGLWTRELLPTNDDYYWLPITQKGGKIEFLLNGAKPGLLSDNSLKVFTEKVLDPLKRVSDLVVDRGGKPFEGLDRVNTWTATTGPWSPIQGNLYLMIKSVEKKIEPPKDKRFDEAVKKYLKDNSKYLMAHKTNQSLTQDSIHSFDLSLLGVKAMQPSKTNNPNSRAVGVQWWQIEHFINLFDVCRDVDKQVNDIKKKYPLLFERHNQKAVKEYIDLINKEKANV
jgi:hypothetical protein